jgi:hypothetical protein
MAWTELGNAARLRLCYEVNGNPRHTGVTKVVRANRQAGHAEGRRDVLDGLSLVRGIASPSGRSEPWLDGYTCRELRSTLSEANEY